MKDFRLLAVAAVVLGLGVAAAYVWAQDEASTAQSAPPAQPANQGGIVCGPGCCSMWPVGQPAVTPMTGSQGVQRKDQAMAPRGMSGPMMCPCMQGAPGTQGMSAQTGGPMMMRCRMMMGAALSPTDPAAILALRTELGLTQEQVTKLEAIEERARADAWATLTDEQKRTLAEAPATPASMMEMCQQMMKQMSGGMGGSMVCPMMGRAPGTQSEPQPAEPTK